MKRVSSRLLRSQRGQSILVLVLILMLFGGAVFGPLLVFMNTGLKAAKLHESKEQGLYAADAGTEDAINWLIHGKPTTANWDWTLSGATGTRTIGDDEEKINGKTVTITVEPLAEHNTYKITSVATGPDGTVNVLSTVWAVHVVEGGVDVEQNTTYYGDVHVTGNVTVENKAKIVGDLTIDGCLNMENNSRIEGDVSVVGNVCLLQHSKITGVVCTGGNVTLGNNVDIVGDMYISGNLTMGNNSHIQGNVFIKGGGISVAQNADITGNVYAYGNITIRLDHPQSKIFGTVYATGTVTIVPSSLEDNVTGGIHGNANSQDYPQLPGCPGVPVAPADIITYEVR